MLLAGLLTACCAGPALPVSGHDPGRGLVPDDRVAAAALQLAPPAPGGPLVPEAAGSEQADATPAPTATPQPSATPAQSGVPSAASGGAPDAIAPPSAPRSFVALGDSLSVWAFPPHSARPSATGAWPGLLAALDTNLTLLHDAGVPGNTTSQMLARLRRDVFAYHPDMLFVLGGTNDVGDGYAVSTTIADLRKIVEAARAQGIEVVLLTIPPNNAIRCSRLARLRATNAAIIALGRAEGVTVVDVYSALVSAGGRLPAAYVAADGLHLSLLGEKVVAATVYARLTAPPPPERDR